MTEASFDQPTICKSVEEPLRWRHLTPVQRRFIANGCGKKGGYFKPPDWIFTASCMIHDFQYWLGYRECDRFRADWQFYRAMLDDAGSTPFLVRPWYKLNAWIYFKAVRMFGKSAFSYGERESTLEDLELEMAAARKRCASGDTGSSGSKEETTRRRDVEECEEEDGPQEKPGLAKGPG